MRFKAIICLCILVCICFSSCVFLPLEDILKTDKPDISNTESSVALPEPSESSQPADTEQTDRSEPEEMISPYDAYVAASENMDTVNSFEKTINTKTVVEFDGKKESVSSELRQKTTGYLSESPVAHITYTTNEDKQGASFRFSSGTGYFEDGKSKLKFACSFEDFEAFAYNYTYPADPEQGELDFFELYKDDIIAAQNDNGGQTQKITGVIKDEKIKKDLLGSIYLSAEKVSDITFDITANIRKDNYITFYKIEIRFNLTDATGEYRYESMNSTSFSRINDNLSIPMHVIGFDDIGSFEALYAFDAYYSLGFLPQYSAVTTRDIRVIETDYDTHDVITSVFYGIQGDKMHFASEIVYDYLSENQKYVNRYYMEDGIYYEKYGNDIFETPVENNFSPVYVWTYYALSPNCGYDYVYTVNDNGTATLEFTYTDDCIEFLAGSYAYQNYTEEYYDMFDTLYRVDSAKCAVVYDLETYALISHTYTIEATFSYHGEYLEYTETFLAEINTENVKVPNRSIFMGMSDF